MNWKPSPIQDPDTIVEYLQGVIEAIRKPGAEIVSFKANHWSDTPELPPKNGFKRYAIGRGRGFNCKIRYLCGDVVDGDS